jgi:hypothetical protein
MWMRHLLNKVAAKENCHRRFHVFFDIIGLIIANYGRYKEKSLRVFNLQGPLRVEGGTRT